MWNRALVDRRPSVRFDGQPVATWDDLRWLLLHKATSQDGVELEVINERSEIAVRQSRLEQYLR